MKKSTLVATLTSPPAAREIESLPPAVGILEVRADLLGDLDPDWLRGHFRGELLYTLRSRNEGGAFEGGKQARKKGWRRPRRATTWSTSRPTATSRPTSWSRCRRPSG